jgi:alkaline phosphatase
VLALVALAPGGAWADEAPAARARNVILLVADGAGFNTWLATSMYLGSTGREFHDAPDWTRLALSAHALRLHAGAGVGPEHALRQVPALVYDPVRAWDPRPAEGGEPPYPHYFQGYRWLRETAPESAATMTALVTGARTYPGAINVDGAGAPLESIATAAHELGKRVGVVSSVQFAHATPAAGSGVHGADRGAYCALAVAMLTGAFPDVLIGCGNPDFDNNGLPLDASATRVHDYVGGQPIWDALVARVPVAVGARTCGTAPGGIVLTAEQVAALRRWTLVRPRAEIAALERGPTPERLLIVPEVGAAVLSNGQPALPDDPNLVRIGGTLQQARGSRADPRYTPPGYDPPLGSVPTLAQLTRVALNALDDDPDGFFLLVEGGAIDWAMHDNQMGRMVEEMLDFRDSILAVIGWVETHGGWDETLVIVTSDHDHLLWGPDADRIPFDPLRDNGRGSLPAYRWLFDDHSNALVPLFARGAGAERLEARATDTDPYYGRYTGQTDVFHVMAEALGLPRP